MAILTRSVAGLIRVSQKAGISSSMVTEGLKEIPIMAKHTPAVVLKPLELPELVLNKSVCVPPTPVQSIDWKRVVKVGGSVLVGGGLLIAAYYLGKWTIRRHRINQRKERAEYIRSLGNEVLQFMREEASGTVPDYFYEEPELPEGLISEEDRGRRSRRRHRSAPFLAKITALAKNHFGGVPEPTKANAMAVSRLVYDLCKEHGCLPSQTRHILSVVVPLVLTPDQFDLSSRELLNDDELAENRATYASLATMPGWLSNLLCNPLKGAAWRRMMDRLVGLPDWQAFRLVH
nr:MAG: hypothetical protein 1 [Gammacarmovirus sp.]